MSENVAMNDNYNILQKVLEQKFTKIHCLLDVKTIHGKWLQTGLEANNNNYFACSVNHRNQRVHVPFYFMGNHRNI